MSRPVILVLRALPEAERTAASIAARGGEARLAPLRRADPIRASVPEPGDVLVATSANALRGGDPIPPAWHARPLVVVGDRTAEAASAAGFRTVHSVDGDVEALIRCLESQYPAMRITYLAGEPRRPILESWALARGIPLTVWPRYRMIDATDLPEPAAGALRNHEIDAVLHFSVESAETYFALAAQAGLTEHASRPLQIALSARVAAAIEQKRVPENRIVVAHLPRSDALLEAAFAALATANDLAQSR
jgi:uroporphyrinogen-III synthase